MLASLPRTSIPPRYWLRAENGVIFKTLHSMALTGDFDACRLGQISECRDIHKERELGYYLASLYLLIGDTESASGILKKHKPGDEMKRYFALLNHCRKHDLPLPSLTHRQERALDNIRERQRPECSLAHRIEQVGGFSIVGNAPANRVLSDRNDLCTFYFNEYRKNSAIEGIASIHVVSPSWRDYSIIESDALLLSGNNILFRRSRVWERFDRLGCISAIYTAPRTLWAGFSATLSASPTAGLLVLGWINDLLASDYLRGKKLQSHVDGFSFVRPQRNHNYNGEALSPRHNWELEPQFTESLVASIRDRTEFQAGPFNCQTSEPISVI